MWVKCDGGGYCNLNRVDFIMVKQIKEYYYLRFYKVDRTGGDVIYIDDYHIYYETKEKAEKALDELMKRVNS